MKRFRSLAALAAVSALALSACGNSDSGSGPEATSGESAGLTKIIVGASPVPHADVLGFISENLAADAGIEIEVKEYNDYVLPNEDLQAGDLDANYFATIPY